MYLCVVCASLDLCVKCMVDKSYVVVCGVRHNDGNGSLGPIWLRALAAPIKSTNFLLLLLFLIDIKLKLGVLYSMPEVCFVSCAHIYIFLFSSRQLRAGRLNDRVKNTN